MDGDLEHERLTVGEYTITHIVDGSYWISRDGGEGMQTTDEKFEKLIDEFYVREF